jgi:branched-subunit amino acid aminotransferase/4-amino-4-deoxychorismate lyase
MAESSMDQSVAWIDGKIQRFQEAALPLSDLGVVAGAAVTELARTFAHQPFRLKDHIARLTESCTELGFPQVFSASALYEAALEVTEKNGGLIRPESDLGIVMFITAGVHPTYLHGNHGKAGTTAVHTFELPFGMWKQSLAEGVSLNFTSVRQIPEQCLPVHRKVRNRLHWWLADREAGQIERGSRALLLDQSNHVTETSTSCFYAVINGEIVTPNQHVLDSMTRRVVEQLAGSLGLRFRKGPIHVDDLQSVEEAFLSSTPVCLLPVSRINGVPIKSGVPGPMFRQLSQAWNELVGLDIGAQIRR